jgi:hypothetical protein
MSAYASYSERYDDPALDVFQGRYKDVLNSFAPPQGGQTAAEVTAFGTMVADSFEAHPHLYLYAYLTTAGPQISAVHRPFRVPLPLGSVEPKHDYALVGDVHGVLTPSLVVFPPTAFTVTPELRVPTDAAFDAAMMTLAPAETIIPAPDHDGPNTERFEIRGFMFVPPRLASLALSRDQFGIREAWAIIMQGAVQLATADGIGTTPDEFAPLMRWLRAVFTLQPEGGLPALHVGRLPVVTGPTARARARLTAILSADLPGWGPNAAPPGAGAGDTTAAINALTDKFVQVNAAAAERERRSKEKSPADYFGDGIGLLCRVTHTASEDELPPLWAAIAKSSKRTERALIEEHLRRVGDYLGLAAYTPVVTPSLAKKLTTLSFSHHHLDDLDGGIQPFVTSYRDPLSRAALEAVVSLYDDVWAGAGAQLQDLAAL